MKFAEKVSLNKVDLVNELSLSNINSLLFLVNSIENNELAIDITRQLSKGKICYVSLHKTADALKEKLKDKNIDTKNIVFVDAITKVILRSVENQKEVYYVSFPGAITELTLTISNILNRPCDYLIFDSLTDLLPYSKPQEIKEFLSIIINKAKNKNVKTIIYIKNAKEVTDFVDDIGPLVSGVINADLI